MILYRTIEEAERAVELAEEDVEADFPGAWDYGTLADVVRSIAEQSLPEVATEILRRNGVSA